MGELKTSSPFFRAVQRGLSWAAADLPGGRLENGGIRTDRGIVRLFYDGAFARNDAYRICSAEAGFTIAAGRPRAFIAAVVNLAAKVSARRIDETVVPRFTSRFYKHEANIIGPGRGEHAWVGDLDEDFWVAYVKALVRMHFTGLVFYAHYHPFEYFLDYDEFAEAPAVPARRRAATLAGLRRAFGVARSFGLSTFMQHYLTHFPLGLARKHGIVFRNTSGGSRLSALDHPVVDRYSRYVYRRTFELLPELSGFYVNFESAPNSGAFVKRCLFPEIAKRDEKPELVFRLWDFNSPAAMKDLIRACPTRFRLAHKVMDRSDAYYFPKADPRVMEWKRLLGDVEFMFIVGPCHNCATAQSRKLWADDGFIRAVLADAEKKGADSIAFHSVFELLSPDIDAAKVAKPREIAMARLNRGHLDAVVDYVRGRKPSAAILVNRLSDRLGVDVKRARLARRAILEASRISLLTFQQYFVTSSQEGYLYPETTSFYQAPFLYPTMRFANDEPSAAMTLTTAWLNRTAKLRNVGDDVAPVIDHANPARPDAPRHAGKIAALLAGHSAAALRLAKRAAGPSPSGVMSVLVDAALEMRNWGMRVRHETRVAASLYGLFFSGSRARSVRLLRAAVAELKSAVCYMRPGDPLSARRLPLTQKATPEKDLARLRGLLRHVQKADFPYPAFAAFARSLERYNEIRRTMRPNKATRPAETRLIRLRLAESMECARLAARLLSRPRCRRFLANVNRWLSFVEAEFAGVTPPSYRVRAESQIAPDDGFVPLVHDQCFRYAENCIEDLDGFFTIREWAPELDAGFRIVCAPDGLVLSLLERNVDAAQRRRGWKLYRGTRGETFFWRFYLDRKCTGRRMDVFSILTGGRGLIVGGFEIHSRRDTVLRTGRPVEVAAGRYTRGRDWWRIDFRLPWRLLGGRPESGEKWRVNVTAMPGCGAPLLPYDNIGRNRQVIWCRGWEFTAANDFLVGKPERMGTVAFE